MIQFIYNSIKSFILFQFIPPRYKACPLHSFDKTLYILPVLCYNIDEVIIIDTKTIEKTSATKLAHKLKTYEKKDLIATNNLIYDSAEEYLNNYKVN